MGKTPIVPPMPNIPDLGVSDLDIQRVKNDPESQARLAKYTDKYKKPTQRELRARKIRKIWDYCKTNWLGIIGAFGSLIAAIYSALAYYLK